MKTILYAILFPFAALLAAIPFGYKVMFSENFKKNKVAWHEEIFSNPFTSPYITICLYLFCGNDKSKLGW